MSGTDAPGLTAQTGLTSQTGLTFQTETRLQAAGLDPAAVADLVGRALVEDLGEYLGDGGDITSLTTVLEHARCTVEVVPRSAGTVAGLPVLLAVADLAPGPVTVRLQCPDGSRVQPGQAVARLTGQTRAVLAIERTALNLLGHLSGVASLTASWVAAVAGTGARIRDTRKTLPGLRSLEKYAVRCGGGVNHRSGLFDAILVKDNHVAAAGGIAAALDAALAAGAARGVGVQIEVDDLAQLDQAVGGGAGQILLDNFDLATLRTAVSRVRQSGRPMVLEASGGLWLGDARAVAETGVDLLAVGALTHSAPQLDIGLDWVG